MTSVFFRSRRTTHEEVVRHMTQRVFFSTPFWVICRINFLVCSAGHHNSPAMSSFHGLSLFLVLTLMTGFTIAQENYGPFKTPSEG